MLLIFQFRSITELTITSLANKYISLSRLISADG